MLGSYVSVAGEAKNDSAAVYGVGAKSCGLWLEARAYANRIAARRLARIGSRCWILE
jgi:hypothetical protein